MLKTIPYEFYPFLYIAISLFIAVTHAPYLGRKLNENSYLRLIIPLVFFWPLYPLICIMMVFELCNAKEERNGKINVKEKQNTQYR